MHPKYWNLERICSPIIPRINDIPLKSREHEMNYFKRALGGMLLCGLTAVSAGLLAHGSDTSEALEDLIVTRHFSGLWEQPEHETQGFVLHIVHQYSGERTAVAFWFTYGEDRESAWLMGQGPVIDNRIELALYQISDVGFLQPNDPGVDAAQVVGSAVMEFDSCQTGTVTFDTDLPEMGDGSFAIEQFGWILNTHCSGGVSDDMPADGRHGQQVLEFEPARDGIQGSGHARFGSYTNHMEFEVEVQGLTDGDYDLYVGTQDRGDIAVREGHGEITYSSPKEDGHRLLNFDPRGQRIEVRDDMGAVLSSFDNRMEEDDHSAYRGGHGNGHGHDDDHDYSCDDGFGMGGGGMGGGGHGGGMGHGDDDCVEEGDFLEVEVDLENTGVLTEAKGEAEWEMNSHRVKFSVEIEDAPAGGYPLHVGGQEVGVIEAFEMHDGEVFGYLGFRDPEMYGMDHLDFDPRGQKIEVLQGETVILEVKFPIE
jgi:hypothetical protein